MTVTLARLNEIVDACETPIRTVPSASAWVSDHVYRMLKSEYRTLRTRMRLTHAYGRERVDLLKSLRSVKLEIKRRQLEFSLTI